MKNEQLYDWIVDWWPNVADLPMSRFSVFQGKLGVSATDAEMRARTRVASYEYGVYLDADPGEMRPILWERKENQ